MAKLSFQDLKIIERKGEIIGEFLGNYEFKIEKKDLETIGKFKISEGSITFPDLEEDAARSQFNQIIDGGLSQLTNRITGKKTLYIHRYSGTPLIGSANFGIIDRNTSLIELRPLTGCNMNCIFCSVDEGISSKKVAEIVVEEEYLANETIKLAKFKECNCEILINAEGEPLLYKPMLKLILDLKACPEIGPITIVTNGTLLSEKLIDELAAAGLTNLNISLNSTEDKTGKIMQGCGQYNAEKIKKIAGYAAKKMKVTLTPVIVWGYNDQEMDNIVAFAKSINAQVAMQNFLYYKKGRNPVNAKEAPWETFYQKLEELQKKYGVKLIFSAADYNVEKTKALPKPFRKNQVTIGKIVGEGRYPGELMAAANGRVIMIPFDEEGSHKKTAVGRDVKIKITSDKHNLFYGKIVR